MKLENLILTRRISIRSIFLVVMFLLMFSQPAGAELKTGDVVTPPLSDELEATLDWTAVTSNVDVDDYVMSDGDTGSKLDMSIPDAYIYSGDGETAVDTGTSYITLEESTILGDYASESKSWSEYAFLETTFGSVTEGGDTAATSTTAPALSASASDVYIKASADFTSANADVGTAAETVSWSADIWNDVDGDGVDDSATVTEEEYIPLSQNVYVLVVAKIVASDTDVDAYGAIEIQFYSGGSDYNILIAFHGAADSASSSTTTISYTDGSSVATGSYNLLIQVWEAEAEYAALLLDIADLVSDDTDSSPNVSGINGISYAITVNDDYGDGTSDTVDFYVHNIAIFDSLPALTDNSLGTGVSVDWNGGVANAATGDATNYAKHDILLPYVVAATNNDWDTRVYIENDIGDSEELLSKFHMLSINGKMRIPPNRDFSDAGGSEVINGITMETEIGETSQRRDVNLYWDLDYKRPSDSADFVTSGFAPVLSSHTFVQVLDDNDVYASSVNKMEEALIEGSVLLGTSDKFDALKTSWDSWTASTTEITTDFWSTDPSDGDNVEIHYSYNTRESAVEADSVQFNWPAAFGFAEDDIPDKYVFGSLGTFGLAVVYFLFGRKKK